MMKKMVKERKGRNVDCKKQKGIMTERQQGRDPEKGSIVKGENDDIDLIFSVLSSVKQEDKKEKDLKKNDKSDEEKCLFLGGDGRRYYDGLPVYTIDELQLGQGGDTKDCPIYCDCCL